MKKAVADLYTQVITRIRVALEENMQGHQKIKAKKEQIDRLASVTIPELRQILDQFGKFGVAHS